MRYSELPGYEAILDVLRQPFPPELSGVQLIVEDLRQSLADKACSINLPNDWEYYDCILARRI